MLTLEKQVSLLAGADFWRTAAVLRPGTDAAEFGLLVGQSSADLPRRTTIRLQSG